MIASKMTYFVNNPLISNRVNAFSSPQKPEINAILSVVRLMPLSGYLVMVRDPLKQ